MAKSKKKSELDVGKGFKRIYFAASAIWIVSWVIIMFQDAHNTVEAQNFRMWWYNGPTYSGVMHDVIIPGLIFMILPIPLYFILLFFIKGFKK